LCTATLCEGGAACKARGQCLLGPAENGLMVPDKPEANVATHQEIAQVSDQELLDRMVSSHAGRFDEAFWGYFGQYVAPVLPDVPSIADIGCGPGLLLRDLSIRYPAARLIGIDVTPAMIDYAKALEYDGDTPQYHLCDISENNMPLEDGSIDLLSMVAVFHVLSDPLAVSRKIQQALAPGGLFLLQDWVRTPLEVYMSRMTDDLPPPALQAARERLLRLFPTHNKYTTSDWLWLLDLAGFEVIDYRELNSPSFRTFVCRAA